MSEKLTKLQAADRRIDTGETPKERPIYRSTFHGVTAAIDPYSKQQFGTVVYPHEATSGTEDHLFAGTMERTLRIMTVAHLVGNKILRLARRAGADEVVPPVRTLMRVDGFAIPDHAHVVMGAAERGAAPIDADPAELDRRWEALRFTEEEAATADQQLHIIRDIAPMLHTNGLVTGDEARYAMVNLLATQSLRS
jgi:hypothetical protein